MAKIVPISQANAVTHCGVFHADEVLATAILDRVLGEVLVARVAEVPDDLSDGVIVYDIGGGEYDHHQRGGNGCRENGVPYASAGLVWRAFGKQVVGGCADANAVWEYVDEMLVQGVDAVDNGWDCSDCSAVAQMTFSDIIRILCSCVDNEKDLDSAFLHAVKLAGEIVDSLVSAGERQVLAKNVVENAIERSDGVVMALDHYVPWQKTLFESVNPKADDILYAVYPSCRGGYNWQCVPISPGSHMQKKPAPESWRGLKGTELQSVTGIPTASFCHHAGFMGSAECFADAVKMAKLAAVN